MEEKSVQKGGDIMSGRGKKYIYILILKNKLF